MKVQLKKVLFGNAVLAAMMSRRKYNAIPQSGNCSGESNVWFFETKSDSNLESLCMCTLLHPS
jgi:hypothetical protein